MTRRQVLTLIAVPTFITGLGVAAFELSDAAGRANCCTPGPDCCAAGAATTAAPAPAEACDPGACCPPSCCTAGGEKK